MTEPVSLEQAAAIAARYAELDGAIGAVEAKRKQRLAKVNAISDARAAPLITERAQMLGQIESWFKSAPADLLKGKKSIELSGCTIGTRSGNATLKTPKDDKPAIASLLRRVWGKALIRTKVELDKQAIKTALSGPNKRELGKLGFWIDTPTTFFIDTSAATIGAVDRSTRPAA